MRRLSLLLLAAIVLASVPIPVSASGVNVSVSEVSVSPSAPAPGETVTITPVIQNLQSSGSVLEVEAVALRGDGTEEYARADGLGDISPGSSLEVSLTTAFEEPGQKNLRVIVYGHPVGDSSANTRIEYPLSFNVRDRNPQVDIQTNNSVEGVATDGSVEIANGLESKLTNVEVNVDGTDIELLDYRGVVASLSPGETASVPFSFRARTAGRQQVSATVNYTIAGNTRRSLSRSTMIRTDSLGDGARITATTLGSGSKQRLAVDILNPTDQPIRNVAVSATSNDATFDEALVPTVQPGESRRVRLNTTVARSPATARVTANYSIGSLEASTNTTTKLRSPSSGVTLTGLDVTREDGRWRISGSASNMGMSTAESVIVSVRDTDRVDPAFPNKEYFVGTVPASDFVSFDLYARTTGNVTSIPLMVSYSLDGNRVQRAFNIETGTINGSAEQRSAGGGLQGGLALGIGTLVVLGAGAAIIVGWRANRDDS